MSTLLTTAEVAERLRVTPETVRSWVRRGLIPEIRISATVRRFDLDDVLVALRKREGSSNAD